jgi:hypothetical protein
MGRWAILTGSADPPGSATKGVTRFKDRENCLRSIPHSVPERGRSGYRARKGGLLLRRRGRSGGRFNGRSREGGFSLVELSIALFLLTTVAVFGFQTMMSGWMLQNASIMQSMTDAYGGIETAYAQRWTFANIPTSGRWPVYPQSSSTVVPIGKTPKGTVNASVVRTSRQYTDPLTGANSYMLESYVVYKDELRQYCKVSKVYRTE